MLDRHDDREKHTLDIRAPSSPGPFLEAGEDRLLPTVLPVSLPALPEGFVAMADRGPEWAAWVKRVPRLARDVVEEWGLTAYGLPSHGHCSLVLPVRTAAGGPALLKLGLPDDESAQEHLALRHWNGRGAVRLLRADPRRRCLLLERLHPQDLDTLGDLEACEVVAGLYPLLHIPAPSSFGRLSERVVHWAEQLTSVPRQAPVPHRLVTQARSLARSFAVDPDTDGVLIHGDLHGANVLAADREPWLAIDPKPLSGDPHLEPVPMLWNRWPEAMGTGDARTAIRRRFHTLVDVAGLEEDRVRDWAVLRLTLNAVWELAAPDPDADWITVAVTAAKAVQG